MSTRGVSYFQVEVLKASIELPIHAFPCHSDHNCQEENIEKKRRMGCLATSNETREKAGKKKKRRKNSAIPRRKTVGTTGS